MCICKLCVLSLFSSLSRSLYLLLGLHIYYVCIIRVVLYARPRQVSFSPLHKHMHVSASMCVCNCHHAASYIVISAVVFCEFPWLLEPTQVHTHKRTYTCIHIYMNMPADSHTHNVTCLPRNCCCAPADYTHIHMSSRALLLALAFYLPSALSAGASELLLLLSSLLSGCCGCRCRCCL